MDEQFQFLQSGKPIFDRVITVNIQHSHWIIATIHYNEGPMDEEALSDC